MFTSIPSHIGIHGNTVVDQEAKETFDYPISIFSIPYSNSKLFIMKYILQHHRKLL